MNDDQKHKDALDQDENTGEESISGSAPDPESDDDTLKAAQDAGLYQDADDEHPAELGIAEEVKKAEEGRIKD